MIRRTVITAFGLAALMTGAMPAAAQTRLDYDGGRPGDREYRLIGPGVRTLYPELRNSNRGRAFVIRNFDANRDGRIGPREAEAANRAFAGMAGARRDRFDWDRRDGVGSGGTNVGAARYDRRAMRNYNFRQTARGATMTMQEDVLFATDSDVLRPAALATLRPLADYLVDNRRLRVSIDGHTDSRGTDAHNQDLSERRAASVRQAFDEMGVTRARFEVVGHGEGQPVATNATAEGMRLNRRVEVTLLGQRADAFSQGE